MGTFSLSHWLVVLAVVLILFGVGRIPNAMGDLARGIRAFRAGMKDPAAGAEGEPPVERTRPTNGAAEARAAARR